MTTRPFQTLLLSLYPLDEETCRSRRHLRSGTSITLDDTWPPRCGHCGGTLVSEVPPVHAAPEA